MITMRNYIHQLIKEICMLYYVESNMKEVQGDEANRQLIDQAQLQASKKTPLTYVYFSKYLSNHLKVRRSEQRCNAMLILWHLVMAESSPLPMAMRLI